MIGQPRSTTVSSSPAQPFPRPRTVTRAEPWTQPSTSMTARERCWQRCNSDVALILTSRHLSTALIEESDRSLRNATGQNDEKTARGPGHQRSPGQREREPTNLSPRSPRRWTTCSPQTPTCRVPGLAETLLNTYHVRRSGHSAGPAWCCGRVVADRRHRWGTTWPHRDSRRDPRRGCPGARGSRPAESNYRCPTSQSPPSTTLCG